jgi:lipoprotein-releasing system permease protein
MKLILQIAKTHLFAKRKQTIIASLGVTFGIAMFILMISFMTGVNKLLEDTALEATPHIRIYNDVTYAGPSLLDEKYPDKKSIHLVHHQKPKLEQKNIKNAGEIVKIIQADPDVLGASPQLTSQVFYSYGNIQLAGSLSGVDINQENKLYNLQSKITSGNIENLLSDKNGVLMGEGLADKLNINMGDKILVVTPGGGSRTMKVVGTFRFGIGTIDNAKCYADISTTQVLLDKSSSYLTEIHIKLKNIDLSKAKAKEYQKKFGYKIEDWETANQTILMSFVIRNVLTFVVVITLLVVAGFGIYNIMNMTIIDKMKDIAILKATGFNGKDIVRIFMTQAIIVGSMGGVAGLILGGTLSYILSRTPFDTGGALNIDTFPVNFDPKFYVFGLVFGILTTCFAGYMPSRKAAKIDPVNILRG